MKKNQTTITFFQFILILKEKIEKDNLKCTCGCEKFKWNFEYLRWRCSKCGQIKSLKSLTFMRDSKLSVDTWYYGICLFFDTDSSISNKQLGRSLFIQRYATVLYMAHKIRKQMSKFLFHFKYKKKVSYVDSFSLNSDSDSFASKKVTLIFKGNKGDVKRLIAPKFIYNAPDAKSCRVPKVKKKYLNPVRSYRKCQSFKIEALYKLEQGIVSLIKEVHKSVSKQHLQFYLDEYLMKHKFSSRTEKANYFIERLVTF